MKHTATPSKKLSWPLSPRKLSVSSYLPAIIYVSWLGTYLDLILINLNLYAFPVRPIPTIFPFNALFTLLVLPLLSIITLHMLLKMNSWQRRLSVLMLAFVMTLVEMLSEKWGWFTHSEHWRHIYTFFGYILFMWSLWHFHRFVNKHRNE